MQMISLRDVSLVAEQVRKNAEESLDYTANTLLGLYLDSEFCTYVQDIVEDEEDKLIHTKKPRSVAVALQLWLSLRGVAVLCEVEAPKYEVLDWLKSKEHLDSCATIELRSEGVQLQWVH